MPAQTSLGYPYPVGTDRVADGDDAIKNLAETIDDKLGTIACGSATFVNMPQAAATNLTVTLPAGRFSGANIFFSVMSYNSATGAASSTSYSVSGFSGGVSVIVTGYRQIPGGTTNVMFNWIAIQQGT